MANPRLEQMVGTFEWDIQTDVVFSSEEIEAIYGLSPGSFGGTYKAWAEFVHPEDWEQAEMTRRWWRNPAMCWIGKSGTWSGFWMTCWMFRASIEARPRHDF
jgi:hypothetical protein